MGPWGMPARHSWTVKAVLAAWIFVGACGDPTGGSTEGPVLFAKLCTQCHGPTGKPTESMAQALKVRDLTDPAVRATLTQARVKEQILQGSATKTMPSFQGLVTDAQADALAAWVVSEQFLTRPAEPASERK